MIKFPVRWIKMSKSWSTVTLSITEELGKDGYQYYAFNANWTRKDNLYLWAYKWTKNWNYLKSWSGSSSTRGFSLDTAVAAANAYGWWYHVETWYARQLINAYYMMKYGNPDCQNVVWKWYTNGSTFSSTWWTNNQTSATYGTSSYTVQCKLLWLEDRWGNCFEWLDWAYCSAQKRIDVSSTWAFSSSSRITSFDKSNTSVTSWWMSSIAWGDFMFAWTGTSWSNSTYYCSAFNIGRNNSLQAGSYFNSWDIAGLFSIYIEDPTYISVWCSARLMYL